MDRILTPQVKTQVIEQKIGQWMVAQYGASLDLEIGQLVNDAALAQQGQIIVNQAKGAISHLETCLRTIQEDTNRINEGEA